MDKKQAEKQKYLSYVDIMPEQVVKCITSTIKMCMNRNEELQSFIASNI